MALLRTLLRSVDALRRNQLTPPSDAILILQQLPPAELLSPTTWAEVLRTVGWLLPDFAPTEFKDECESALRMMQSDGFASLGVKGRVALLRALCDACLQVIRTSVQGFIRDYITALRR